jgi:cellulose biosynthesis protein BcsQ
MRIAVQGVKGGVGTTTITVALATLLNANISAIDPTDLQTILTEKPTFDETKRGMHVRDLGVTKNFQTYPSFEINVLVTRNDFLSLSRCNESASKFDLLVIQRVEKNAIAPEVFANACNAKRWIEIDVKPNIARSIDAGLFTSRMPDEIKLPLQDYTNEIAKELV